MGECRNVSPTWQLSEQSQSDPTEEEVRGSLDRVLASGTFAQSGRMARFLGYIVEETLDGRSDLLKEYPIAIEAFERDDSFDPQTSSLVRVEAGRLRTKLHEYYDSDGADDPVIIELPRGGYVPTFAHQPLDWCHWHGFTQDWPQERTMSRKNSCDVS